VLQVSYLGWPLLYGGSNLPMLPGIAIALVLALALSGWAARRLGTGRVAAWLLLANVGVILAVTLAPRPWGLESALGGTASCDLSRIGPASLATYLSFDDPILNVLLFIPLGVLVANVDGRRQRRTLALGAAFLPLAIEIVQAVAMPLGRACQGGDVFDNLAGLVIGLAIGAVWRRASVRP
jgi:hypothetical protein